MWSTATAHPAPSHAYGDDRRRAANAPYPRSSTQHSSSSSSLGSYSTAAFSHGSPSASSVSTASSSVRTPPDLLLNGATLATSFTHPAAGSKAHLLGKSRDFGGDNTASFEQAQQQQRYHTSHMTLAQIESRLTTLARVSRSNISDVLPSPPKGSGSTPAAGRPRKSSSPSRSSQKRKIEAVGDAAAATSSSPPNARRMRRESGAASERDMAAASASSSPPSSSLGTLTLPRVRDWSKEQYIETAKEYRVLGRSLKHRGDRRLREMSTELTSPKTEAMVAGLEQTDALLLYTYGFWCEDQGAGTCVTANWNSLFGLLKYVYVHHDKSKTPLLSGFCRFLEACVLRHVAAHDMRMLTHRMGKASSSVDAPTRADVSELSSMMSKAVGAHERSIRLAAQARQSVLSLARLQESYPRVADFCAASLYSSTWTSLDQASLALRLDPSVVHEASDQPASSASGWSWPMDATTPFPMIVCFGRALLREAARQAGVNFFTEPVAAV